MPKCTAVLISSLLVGLMGCQTADSDRPIAANQDAIVDNRDARDLRKFLSYWPGEYENSKQVAQQSASNRPSKDRNDHLRIFIRRVDVPSFGNDVYYVEWQNPDNRKLVRQRIYAFEKNDDEYILRLHIFPTDKAFRAKTGGAYLEPWKLNDLKPENMVQLSGCDIYLKRDGDAFVGGMKRGDCIINYTEEDQDRFYSWTRMRITPTSFQYLDGWFHTDHRPAEEKDRAWYVFEKEP